MGFDEVEEMLEIECGYGKWPVSVCRQLFRSIVTLSGVITGRLVALSGNIYRLNTRMSLRCSWDSLFTDRLI